jgi:hypothetical protein
MSRGAHQARKKYLLEPFIQQICAQEAPIEDVQPYISVDMSNLRNKLNKTKSLLDKYYIDKHLRNLWSSAQYSIDLYKNLRMILSKEYNMQYPSNASMKYYEIYNYFNVLGYIAERFPGETPTVKFNAELPGSALCAMNHLAKTNNVEYNWYASSLIDVSDTTTTALDDSYGLYRCNKEHWLMDDSNNGDATLVKNLLDFKKKIPLGVHLYSHDAGIDVTNDFNNQESANAKVHLGCALAGLMLLKTGGIFIAKQYTMFESLTWNLILIYSALFEKFYLFKPLTSRPYNSEVYLIGIGFKGISEELLNKLLNKLENFNMNALFSNENVNINNLTAYNQIYKFANNTFNTQIDYIRESINLFELYKNDLRRGLRALCEPLQKKLQATWIRDNKVKRINTRDWLNSECGQ